MYRYIILHSKFILFITKLTHNQTRKNLVTCLEVPSEGICSTSPGARLSGGRGVESACNERARQGGCGGGPSPAGSSRLAPPSADLAPSARPSGRPGPWLSERLGPPLALVEPPLPLLLAPAPELLALLASSSGLVSLSSEF